MSLLPSHAGLLPYWFIIVSALSLFNTIDCYRTTSIALRTYEGPIARAQVTDFGSRMFGTWTILSCIIRCYGAYRIDNPDVYFFVLCTYIVALSHFGSERLYFGTMKPGAGLARVGLVASGSIMWMVIQWNFYVAA